MEAKFIVKKLLRKGSNKDLNCIKVPNSLSVFRDLETGRYFECSDVKLLRKKRNMVLDEFFDCYKDIKKFDLVEFGIPYLVTDNIARIIQKVKRRCKAMGKPLLGYVWVFDVGNENCGAHYHFVISTSKNFKSQYPNELKISFKGKSLHGAYVRKRQAFKHYLQGKEVFERGYRKRVYGLSQRFK